MDTWKMLFLYFLYFGGCCVQKAYAMVRDIQKLGFRYVLSPFDYYIRQNEIPGFCHYAVSFYGVWTYFSDYYPFALKKLDRVVFLLLRLFLGLIFCR